LNLLSLFHGRGAIIGYKKQRNQIGVRDLDVTFRVWFEHHAPKEDYIMPFKAPKMNHEAPPVITYLVFLFIAVIAATGFAVIMAVAAG
jgi:Na+(H+)/acetate symporter ActP